MLDSDVFEGIRRWVAWLALNSTTKTTSWTTMKRTGKKRTS